ncbi:GyrI-like domain-containing protein [Bacteroidota bacterium]
MRKKYKFNHKLDIDDKNRYTVSEYISRINRVIDYIDANICEELKLNKLSEIANFSPYHFHRVFRGMVGETLNQFIHRIRIEKSVMFLVGNPNMSITEIALDCGFSGSASFARAFKDYFKMSASEFRDKVHSSNSKIGIMISKDSKQNGKPDKAPEDIEGYFGDVLNDYFQNNERKNAMNGVKKVEGKVEVKELSEMNVAYVRHIGPYKGDSGLFEGLFGKLFQWAGPRGLLNFPNTQSMAVYHDDPEITHEDKLRTSVCITVPEEIEVSGEVGKMKIDGGRYAVARFELDTADYPGAWDFVFSKWLPESGYQPNDGVCFEVYQNDPKQHPEGKCIVDICVPVRPL